MTFPAAILPVKAALLLGQWPWTDITSYVYQRDTAPITVTRGRADESSQVNPASLRGSINNRDGRFSSANPTGPYYGQIGRNTPIRFSVPASGTYLRMEDDTVSYASCPDASGLDITGSVDIRLDVSLSGYSPAVLASKWVATLGERSWALLLDGDGTLTLAWTTDGTPGTLTQATSTMPVPLGPGVLRATLTASTGVVTFYTAPAGGTTGGPYTQLGLTAGAGSTSLYNSNAAVAVGYAAGPAADFTITGPSGQFSEFQLINSGGATVAHAIFTSQAEGTTSFTDTKGNVWTLAGTAEISMRSYRFHGEMSSVPKAQDPSGTDLYVPLTCGSILRRLQQGSAPLYSPIRRAVQFAAGAWAPVAYWPCEDGAGATALGSAFRGPPLAVSGSPQLASDSSFACSSAIPVLNGAVFTGQVPAYASSGSLTARFLLHVPSGGEANPVLLPLTFATTGTVATVVVASTSTGVLEVQGSNAGGVLFTSGGTAALAGKLALVSVELTPGLVGGTVDWALSVLTAGSTVPATLSGSLAGTVGTAIAATVNSGGLMSTSGLGHLFFQSALEPLAGLAGPLAAWAGETAGDRFARLCSESGIASRIYGYPAMSAAMGAQAVDTLPNLLQACEDADKGMIYDPRQAYALGYRTLASLLNQQPAVTLSWTGQQLAAAGFTPPTDDDLYTMNDATVQRVGGSSSQSGMSYRFQLDDGSAMSISPPPAGAGDYASSYSPQLASDSQLADYAGWVVHVGTVGESRYPAIPADLARPAVSGLFYALQDVNIGDYIAVSSPPPWLTPDTIRQLAAGVTEELGGYTWRITWNGIPEAPYEVAVSDDLVLGRADTDGSALHANITSSAASMQADTAAGFPLWTTAAGDFPFDIAMGGERITVTAISGSSSPQTFTITRSVNGVVKSHTAGEDIRLWSAPVLAIA